MTGDTFCTYPQVKKKNDVHHTELVQNYSERWIRLIQNYIICIIVQQGTEIEESVKFLMNYFFE